MAAAIERRDVGAWRATTDSAPFSEPSARGLMQFVRVVDTVAGRKPVTKTWGSGRQRPMTVEQVRVPIPLVLIGRRHYQPP